MFRHTDSTADEGPPQVTEDEIHNELGRLFEFVSPPPDAIGKPDAARRYPAWSCLLLRPTVAGK